MNIVCCCDNNFAQHCGVLITSILENNKKELITIHLLTDSLSCRNQNLIKKIVKNYNKKIEIYYLDNSILNTCPVRKDDHVSIAAYFRILIPNILPKSLDKVLYLDCDIVVRKNIQDLWNCNVEGFAMGVIPDMSIEDIRNYNRLEYDRSLGYFNSGVMLINLKHWRENNITNTILQFINNYPDRLKWWDQDALNSVLITQVFNLPYTYNMQDYFYHKDPSLKKGELEKIKYFLKDPCIIHYTTSMKPWFKESRHPFKKEYYKYLALTPWRKYHPQFHKRFIFNYIRYYGTYLGLFPNVSPYINIECIK